MKWYVPKMKITFTSKGHVLWVLITYHSSTHHHPRKSPIILTNNQHTCMDQSEIISTSDKQMNFNRCMPLQCIAGGAKRITNTPHQHQHTSHKYFPDNQMNFNLCIPLPGKQPRETSGNLLSVQFTPLVSRAMVKFHTRKHLIVSTILDRSIIWLTRGESVKRENNKSRSSNAKRWAGYKRIYKIDTNIFSNEWFLNLGG